MPESRRLNQMVICYFCDVRVNPYVVKTLDDEWHSVECPNCQATWEVKEEHGELLVRNYR